MSSGRSPAEGSTGTGCLPGQRMIWCPMYQGRLIARIWISFAWYFEETLRNVWFSMCIYMFHNYVPLPVTVALFSRMTGYLCNCSWLWWESPDIRWLLKTDRRKYLLAWELVLGTRGASLRGAGGILQVVVGHLRTKDVLKIPMLKNKTNIFVQRKAMKTKTTITYWLSQEAGWS